MEGSLISGGDTAPAAAAPQEAAPAPQPQAAPVPETWYSAFPEDIRGSQDIHQFQGPDELARAYLNAKQLLGKDPTRTVEISGEPEARRALLNRLGLPEKAEDYKLNPVDDAGDYGKPDSEMAQWLAKEAHEIGILPDQMQDLFGRYALHMKGAENALVEENAKLSEGHIASLRQEFGQAFDEKVAQANAAARHFGLVDSLNNARLGAEPSVIKALAALGATLQEGAGGPPSGKGSGKMTPEAATAKANDLTQQAFRSQDRHEKQRLTEEALRYRRMAHGG